MPAVDKKTTALPVAATVVGADLVDVVIDVAGTATSKKATLDVLATFVNASATTDFSSDQNLLAVSVFN